jgi:hypothetical protein
MPVEVKGALELRKAIKKFSPELAKETRKELANLLAPIVKTARGFVPNTSPLSGWGKAATSTGRFPIWDSGAAKSGIGYKTSPSKPNNQGFKAIARIVNNSAAGAIYETAGRKNPQGQPNFSGKDFIYRTGSNGPGDFQLYYFAQDKTTKRKGYNNSANPNAGKQFIDAINANGQIVDANNQTGAGKRSRKMRGRAIFRAWADDGGKTNAAVLKAIENSKIKFYNAMGVK